MEGEELTEEQLEMLLTDYTGQEDIGFAVVGSRKFGTEYAKRIFLFLKFVMCNFTLNNNVLYI